MAFFVSSPWCCDFGIVERSRHSYSYKVSLLSGNSFLFFTTSLRTPKAHKNSKSSKLPSKTSIVSRLQEYPPESLCHHEHHQNHKKHASNNYISCRQRFTSKHQPRVSARSATRSTWKPNRQRLRLHAWASLRWKSPIPFHRDSVVFPESRSRLRARTSVRC